MIQYASHNIFLLSKRLIVSFCKYYVAPWGRNKAERAQLDVDRLFFILFMYDQVRLTRLVISTPSSSERPLDGFFSDSFSSKLVRLIQNSIVILTPEMLRHVFHTSE
jgi:hypothetical protein